MAPPRALSPAQLAEAFSELADPKRWEKAIKAEYRPVARAAARDVREEMRRGDRQLAAAARGVTPRVDVESAAVAVTAGKRVPFALAATWGMKRRTGWNAMVYAGKGNPVGPRAYRSSAKRQHPAWVGNDWPVATRGRGPRGVNDALADHRGEYAEAFAAASERLIIRALPIGLRTR